MELNRSCGDTRWLFRVLARAPQARQALGLNWKRGNIGDLSQDILTYNWSSDPDEGTVNIRVYDVIGGHCGPNPGPNFDEKTILGTHRREVDADPVHPGRVHPLGVACRVN